MQSTRTVRHTTLSFIAGKRAPTGMNHVGASLLAKRPVHPNIFRLQDHRLREQARSHRFCIRPTALSFFAGKPRSNRHLIRPRLHDPGQVVLDPGREVFHLLGHFYSTWGCTMGAQHHQHQPPPERHHCDHAESLTISITRPMLQGRVSWQQA